jgi:hypothetical protein
VVSRITDRLGDPVWMRRFHGWATLLWFVAAVPICLILANSLAFVVWISVYAIVIGHFSAWQAARAEIVADPEIDPGT